MADAEKLKEKKRQLEARVKKIEPLENTKKAQTRYQAKSYFAGMPLSLAIEYTTSKKILTGILQIQSPTRQLGLFRLACRGLGLRISGKLG